MINDVILSLDPWTARRRHNMDIKGQTMTTFNIITVVDRFALSLLNAIALVGVPLIAIGVLTQTL